MKRWMFGLMLLVALKGHSEVSDVWKTFSQDCKNGKTSVIPDYSWAGYKYGACAIPDVSSTIFDVTDYGAFPNDGKSDYDGIQRTIRAAEKNGSGIVFFPPGQFLVAEKKGIHDSIQISGSNIVLRGSGSGPGGTEIFQRNHYVPANPSDKWTTPSVFLFKPAADSIYPADQRGGSAVLAKIVMPAENGSFHIQVADSSRVKPGWTVALCMQNPAANDYYLQGLKPRDIFTEIINKGVSVSEKHTVVKVEGNTLFLEEPLHTDMDPAHGWSVRNYPTLEGWGVEDIHFSGNSPTPFVHHKDYIHDSGYQVVNMRQGKNCWIRRCRFSNLSHAFYASGCMSSSFLMNTVDGHQGHGSFNMNWGYGNLIGLCQDLTDKGTFHGCGISHEQVGGVIWRYESVGETRQTPRFGGPDFHAQFPYCSLWDCCAANLRDNGGSYTLQPNHLRDLTFWNFEQVGAKIYHDYWNMPKTEEDSKSKYYGKTKVVYPNYIGFNGVMSTFNEDHLGLVESYGAPVEPESLYEAQLALRLGAAPAWVADDKAEWKKIQAMHRLASSSKKPNVLTIILDDAGWKDVGFTGGELYTPTIDRLAGQGVRLNQFYTYSTCTPTRAAFFTGEAPSRSGIVYPIQSDDHYGIPAEKETLPEVFRANGYQTALIGKWHLGVQPELAPNAHGFDQHYGIRGGWADQFTRENPVTGYDWYRNDQFAAREEGHTTDLLTAEAVRYLNGVGVSPFFLCLSYTAPHVPIQVDPEWAAPYEGRFATKTRQGYAGMMAQLDDSIGQVIRTLEKKGLLENTLVVLFSDNGPSAPGKKWYIPEDFHKINFYGNDGVYGDVGPLRGWKASPYDGGIRTPAFIYWRGKLTASEMDEPVIVQDLYHTILSLVDLNDPSPGCNIFASKEPQTLYWRTPGNLAVRRGDWKLLVLNASPFGDDLNMELYNTAQDISESEDCSETHPEKCEELLGLMKSEFKKDAPPHVNEKLMEQEGK